MFPTDKPLSREDRDTLAFLANMEDGLGFPFEFTCDVSPEDHLHARRIGTVAMTQTRVQVLLHDARGETVTAYLNTAKARQFAAIILNIADEIDGTTPLVFHPRPAEEG